MNRWQQHETRQKLQEIIANDNFYKRYEYNLNKIVSGELNTWDYPWIYTCMINGVSIVPSHNLISNIGFDEFATHTTWKASPLSRLPARTLRFPLMHPQQISSDNELTNQLLSYIHFQTKSHLQRDKANWQRFFQIAASVEASSTTELIRCV